MIRRSVAAGSFYPYDTKTLAATIENFFVKNFGQKTVIKKDKTVVCGLCPHAGYLYSGSTASHFYHELANNMPNRFIIIGPNHTGRGSPIALMDKGEWQTPLGTATIDNKLASKIISNSEIIDIDHRAHEYEHSIEIQLPFLQYLRKDITFVPLSLGMQDLDSVIDVAQAINKTIKEDVGVIASSDLVHFGRNYRYAPFVGDEKETLEWIEKHDRQVLSFVVEKDVEGLYDFLSNLDYTMCGYGPASVAMLVSSNFDLEGKVLNYSTSYDVSHDSGTVVGYGAVIFR
ncbi:MAG: AmmeMemoRadiSam system protein B [Candidatus Methanofastidiosia archaeon]